ncbi:MAG: hypothetical protein V5A88_07320 [Candidatus Thermoplasmatota archaeon]
MRKLKKDEGANDYIPNMMTLLVIIGAITVVSVFVQVFWLQTGILSNIVSWLVEHPFYTLVGMASAIVVSGWFGSLIGNHCSH